MKINLSNFETSDVSLFDVSIVQRDVGGGKTEKEDIDCLEEYPTAKSLIISGLNQECFEYLIKHYGSQFEAISRVIFYIHFYTSFPVHPFFQNSTSYIQTATVTMRYCQR